MSAIPYHKTFQLVSDLEGVECWNFSRDTTADIPAGHYVRLEHSSSTTATVVMHTNVSGEAIGIECSNGQRGYRFVVNNVELGKAIGQELPATTKDLVGDIMRYENGEMDEDEARAFLQGLHDDGTLYNLQGSYQRAYQALCCRKEEE